MTCGPSDGQSCSVPTFGVAPVCPGHLEHEQVILGACGVWCFQHWSGLHTQHGIFVAQEKAVETFGVVGSQGHRNWYSNMHEVVSARSLASECIVPICRVMWCVCFHEDTLLFHPASQWSVLAPFGSACATGEYIESWVSNFSLPWCWSTKFELTTNTWCWEHCVPWTKVPLLTQWWSHYGGQQIGSILLKEQGHLFSSVLLLLLWPKICLEFRPCLREHRTLLRKGAPVISLWSAQTGQMVKVKPNHQMDRKLPVESGLWPAVIWKVKTLDVPRSPTHWSQPNLFL